MGRDTEGSATGRRKVRMSDVAELAGVSLATVDRVLNLRGGVSIVLEQKVLAAAEHLDIDRNLQNIPRNLLRFSVLMNKPDRFLYQCIHKAIEDYQALHTTAQFHCTFNYFRNQHPNAVASRIASVRRGFDGAIIIAYENDEINEAIRLLARRMPVATLITDLPNSGRSAFFGPDNRKAGRLAGDLMGRFVGENRGRVLIIRHNTDYHAHIQRERGFIDVLGERHKGIRGFFAIECPEETEEWYHRGRSDIAANGPFVGIYNISSWTNRSLKELFSERDLQKTVLISHNVGRESWTWLDAGYLDAVIEHAPEKTAQTALRYLLKLHGRHVEVQPIVNPFFDVYLRERLPPSRP